MDITLTRREFIVASALALESARARGISALEQQPRPTRAQLEWQRDELALFLHFGVNTFTDREWGDGREDPGIFAPARLDTRQWARAARAGGFRALILTAKHHDGFCLWPTRTTRHSVASSPWKNGSGDVVREFVDSCRAEGLKAGLYLSPWDRHEPTYGDSPRYNDFYCDQLTELLTQYGPLQEVWFDGANGEGPNGRRQEYDWPRIWGLVRRLQPNAVMFSDAGPDVRWIGNENGVAGDPNWSTVDPAVVPRPGVWNDVVKQMLQHGDARGTVWRPGESDVSIRPGWFHHPAEDARVKTVDQLVDLYFQSVGRNSKLLLNVPPTRDGILPDTDVARLAGMRERLAAMFANELTGGRALRRLESTVFEMDLGRVVRATIADLREDITQGQRVARYVLEGAEASQWRVLSRGTTIGCRKLDRFEPAAVRRLRLRIEEAVTAPEPLRLRLFHG
jgi:alpha-L-fucosidase